MISEDDVEETERSYLTRDTQIETIVEAWNNKENTNLEMVVQEIANNQ